MQLRFRTGLTGEQYVTAQGWLDATLVRCPNHPSGGCSLARHGTYERKTPPGTHIARWYCPESHTTFSRLPDCLAARLPGTLAELEEAVATAERSPTVTAAAVQLRSGRSEPPGALRWLRRRMRLVRRALTTVIGLLPEHFANAPPTLLAFRDRLGTGKRLRAKAEQHYVIPGTTRTRIAAETLGHWLSAYRQGGFNALVPKQRTDRGRPRRLPPDIAEMLISIKEDHPAYSVRAVIDAARVCDKVPSSNLCRV